MSKKSGKLELGKVFQSDAAEIVASRKKSRIIHGTKDISASGKEVEMTVRKVLRRKLPTAYYIGHGHVVDANWTPSTQLDVVIADNAAAPVLFQSEDGTEYFPYESVYAIGEIKSTYYERENYVKKFVDTLDLVRTKLYREKTPINYISPYLTLNRGFDFHIGRDYKNPLFSFMLFVSSNDFEVGQLKEIYASRPASELPNALCFLDQGLVVRAKVSKDLNSLGPILPFPEFSKEIEDEVDHWLFIPVGIGDNRLGANLGFLYFLLINHIKDAVLMPPDLLEYCKSIFVYKNAEIIDV